MKVIVDDLAIQAMNDIFFYNMRYSLKNAIKADTEIKLCINDLTMFPYAGRYIPEIPDKHFREIICRKARHSCYRIVYYVSNITDTVYVLNVLNSKQDFNRFLRLHSYFKNFFRL